MENGKYYWVRALLTRTGKLGKWEIALYDNDQWYGVGDDNSFTEAGVVGPMIHNPEEDG